MRRRRSLEAPIKSSGSSPGVGLRASRAMPTLIPRLASTSAGGFRGVDPDIVFRLSTVDERLLRFGVWVLGVGARLFADSRACGSVEGAFRLRGAAAGVVVTLCTLKSDDVGVATRFLALFGLSVSGADGNDLRLVLAFGVSLRRACLWRVGSGGSLNGVSYSSIVSEGTVRRGGLSGARA